MKKKLKVHIVGTHGVPAKYGGFETLADFLCQNLQNDFDFTVYCNANKYKSKVQTYFGARLKYLKLDASGVQGIIYDLITYIYALFTAEIILYLSPVGSGFITPLRFFFKTKVIVNHGGLNEWDREKLNGFQKRWAKFNHRIAAKFSNVNIADNFLYQESLKDSFNASSVVIRYGGDHVQKIEVNDTRFVEKYPFTKDDYAVSVSRAQIDNNLHLVLEAFESFKVYKVVLVANWSVSKYGVDLKEKYKNHPNMILLDGIYDKEELDYVRGNAKVYIHSHSRCGTAPSLVEAMCLKNAIVSYDVPTNRETTKNKALYFSDSESLRDVLNSLTTQVIQKNETEMFEISQKEYSWNVIAKLYKEVIKSLIVK